MLIGAMKSGTTSIYQYLSGHPNLYCTSEKEPSYFSWRYRLGLKEYLKHFPKKSDLEDKLVFDASVTYLHDPKSALRIKKLLPNTKFIVVLRDPIERAISHFYYYSSNTSVFAKNNPLTIEKRTIEKAFRDDLLKTDVVWNKQYCKLSLYGKQLKQFYNLFNDKNILVLDFGELQNNPKEILLKISSFLDIDTKYFESFYNTENKIESEKSFQPEKTKTFNIYNAQNYSVELPNDLKKELIDFYKNDIELLKRLTHINFLWEKTYLEG